MLKLLIVTIIVVALAIGLIAIKMFVKKGGEFKKSCSSVDPDTGERFGCTCGKSKGETCENKSGSHQHEIEFEEITAQ
jgi:hypothetical protein